MLLELDIRDFAIIDHVRLRLTPGFNVLTGETGAGKSIIVDAVGQLLGERGDSNLIRAGAERALVEGQFELPEAAARAVQPVLDEYGLSASSPLILFRELGAGGRSLARINGRAVPVKALADVGVQLVDLHGQSDSASLKRETEHLGILDRYAGLEAERARVAEVYATARRLERELAALEVSEAERLKRVERLTFEVEEISLAGLADPGEDAALTAERQRMQSAEKLAGLVQTAFTALRGADAEVEFARSGPGGEEGVLDALAVARRAMDQLSQIDASQKNVLEALVVAEESLADVVRQLASYSEGLAFNPERLAEIDERVGLLTDLKRKYGATLEAVIAHGEQAADELAQLESHDERRLALAAEREAALADYAALAAELSQQRRSAGDTLAEAVEEELAALGMSGSRFEVILDRRDDPNGVLVDGRRLAFDATGIDRAAFHVSANPGEPVRPLVRVASGGETARLMLALKNVLSRIDGVPTLIFDEIDTGVGGRIGSVVGEKLWAVADRHQVLCVTHLPQVAAYGDSHYHVRKRIDEGRTRTEIEYLADGARVDEVAAMLGTLGDPGLASAASLLADAAAWKLARRAG